MARPHKRPPEQPPLIELTRLRQELFPEVLQKDFAKKLGITRLHMSAVEMGRRRPSLDLTLRWMALLAPKARLDMFGHLPVVEERVRALKKLQELSPDFFQAA